jgi:RNA polymerase sigma-70 factor (ECF subfamily)
MWGVDVRGSARCAPGRRGAGWRLPEHAATKATPHMSVTLVSTSAFEPPRTARPASALRRETFPARLDPDRLPGHLVVLYCTARGMCRSREDAEDLVQETLVNVLARPRLWRDGSEIGFLRRALQNTNASRHRAALRRPATSPLFDHDAPAAPTNTVDAREIFEAIAGAPAMYRDAVIAVDVLGLSYREAARSLNVSEATLTSRLHRGRQRVTRLLLNQTTAVC